MQRYAVKWRRLSRSGKAFFVFAAAWVLLYFTRISPALQVLLALGAMSVAWMLLVAAIVFVEKVPRGDASLVVPVALLLVGVGTLTVLL